MDSERVAGLREALAHTSWWAQATLLGSAVRRTRGAGHLLLVGTPAVEPWHLAAHLDDEARLTGMAQLAPQLVRWNPPRQAPDHLTIGLDRLERASRGETVFVVAPEAAPDVLLERVDDARRIGATVLSLDGGDDELGALAHERMSITGSGLLVPEALVEHQTVGPRPGQAPPEVLAGLSLPASFEVAQHFVSTAAGLPPDAGPRGWRARLAGLLDLVSGPSPHQQHRR
jgi:hypothetical protein